MNDTERLNWLEKSDGFALISDDFGHWACVTDGVQNVPDSVPADISTTFWIEKHEWESTIRKAVDKAIKKEKRIEKLMTKLHLDEEKVS